MVMKIKQLQLLKYLNVNTILYEYVSWYASIGRYLFSEESVDHIRFLLFRFSICECKMMPCFWMMNKK
jgi:hypothetical protein